MKIFNVVLTQALGGGKVSPSVGCWNISNTAPFIDPSNGISSFGGDFKSFGGIGLGPWSEPSTKTSMSVFGGSAIVTLSSSNSQTSGNALSNISGEYWF